MNALEPKQSNDSLHGPSILLGLAIGAVGYFLFRTHDGAQVRTKVKTDAGRVYGALMSGDLEAVRQNPLVHGLRAITQWLKQYARRDRV